MEFQIEKQRQQQNKQCENETDPNIFATLNAVLIRVSTFMIDKLKTFRTRVRVMHTKWLIFYVLYMYFTENQKKLIYTQYIDFCPCCNGILFRCPGAHAVIIV